MAMLGGLQLGGPAMHGLKLPARCLAAVMGQQAASSLDLSDTEHADAAASSDDAAAAARAQVEAQLSQASLNAHSHRFLVGTCSVKEDNEIHCIEFDEEGHELRSAAVFRHPQEVWHLSACPSDASICATTYALSNDSEQWQSTLWRMPGMGGSDSSEEPDASQGPLSPSRLSDPQPLTKLVDLTGHVGRAKGVVWNHQEGARNIVSLDSQCIRMWQLSEGATALKTPTATLSGSVEGGPTCAAWDPHHSSLLASGDGRHLRTWDLRAGSDSAASAAAPSLSVECAHEDLVRCVDYNPNRPYHLLSCGQDRRVHVWDLRAPAAPLQTLLAHSHWALAARYNAFHDQLVLSAGTERVCLWSLTSTSSAPVGELEATASGSGGSGKSGSGGGAADALLKAYSDHEDSVYGAVWSARDAWVFATLSYDGRVVVNHVPPAEKYKILL